MLYLGTGETSEVVLTFFIVFAIACYLAGAMFTFLYGIHEKRRDTKQQRLLMEQLQHTKGRLQEQSQQIKQGVNSVVRIVPLPTLNASQPGVALMRSTSTIRKAETLQNEHEEHERRLLEDYERRAAKQRRHTRRRVEARALLRRSKALGKVDMFKHLGPEEIDTLIAEMVLENHPHAAEIVSEGHVADAFYVVIKGSCGVFTRSTAEKRVGVLGPLSIFGENSLVDGSHNLQGDKRTRNATVVVESSAAQTLKLTASSFLRLLRSGRLGSETGEQSVLEMVKRVSAQRHTTNMSLFAEDKSKL